MPLKDGIWRGPSVALIAFVYVEHNNLSLNNKALPMYLSKKLKIKKGEPMKNLVFVFACLIISFNSFGATSDLECVGDLTKDSFSRRIHLSMNEAGDELIGYRGTMETGGVFFRAKEIDGFVLLNMAQDLGDREVQIASASISKINADISLDTQLEGYEVAMRCFYF